MGGPVIERRGGSVVWVLRQNGTWWPGRILCSNEIPTSGILSRTDFSSRFPIKLLGRDDASVCWYNLEKSSRVKAFRCGEFDGCIKKAESSKNFTYTKSLKYAHREDAILHALELEKQDQEKLERPVFFSGFKEGETHGESNQRAKRSRRFYSPIDSISFLEKSVHSQSSNMVATSIHAAEISSSKSMSSLKSESQSSHKKRETTAGNNALRPTKMNFKVISRPAVNKWKHNGKVHNQHFKSRSVVSTNERSTEFGSKTESFEIMSRDVNRKSQLSPGNSFTEDTSIQSLSSKFTTRKNSTKTLIDVHMTVQSTYRGEHTPLVSLMSRLNGKTIVGHPINIEVLYDSSMLPVEKESSDQLQNKGRMPQLVWRTSKRTPVCYTSSTSSATKYENLQHSSNKLGDLSSQARKNSPFNTESRGKLSKKPNMSKNKPRSLYLADSRIKNAVKDTCVPVKDIFIKLIGALGNV
ncbi:uncharacterized protein At1g51745-like [Solanum tuberosum]|uniref:Micronuclear linker histone polyprotein n=3 Tax=Solanum tuberosum TaxID=4113 RepID=M1AJC7_SOLTU|nr:PREDICTED: uncharacterized protein At1g51745-like [Solanum tuberosum]